MCDNSYNFYLISDFRLLEFFLILFANEKILVILNTFNSAVSVPYNQEGPTVLDIGQTQKICVLKNLGKQKVL